MYEPFDKQYANVYASCKNSRIGRRGRHSDIVERGRRILRRSCAVGKYTLPFSDEEIYMGLTAVFTVAATVWAWWKNNSFTQNAIAADEYKAQLDEGGAER